MGAALILGICAVPDAVTEETVEAFRGRARRFPDEDPEGFEFVRENHLGNAAHEEGYDAWRAAGFDDEEIETAAERLTREIAVRRLTLAVDTLIAPLVPMSEEERQAKQAHLPPDTILHVLDGKRYLFTGGPTWGDDPTDSYDLLVLLDWSRIAEEPAGRGARIAGGVRGALKRVSGLFGHGSSGPGSEAA